MGIEARRGDGYWQSHLSHPVDVPISNDGRCREQCFPLINGLAVEIEWRIRVGQLRHEMANRDRHTILDDVGLQSSAFGIRQAGDDVLGDDQGDVATEGILYSIS